MSDLELRFFANGSVAERTSLELASRPAAAQARRAPRARVPGSRMVYETSARAASPIGVRASYFDDRFVQAGDEAFVEGVRAISAGRRAEARWRLADVRNHADASFLGAALALLDGDARAAERGFDAALGAARRLGRTLRRYDLDATIWLQLTPELSLSVLPTREGVLFAQAVLLRELGQVEPARAALAELQRLAPQDVVVRLCLADLLLARTTRREEAARRVLRLSDGVANTSTQHASLLLFRARALRRLGRARAALTLCARVVGRANARPRELVLAFQFERARAAGELHDFATEQRVLSRLDRLAPGYAEARAPLDLGALS